MLVEYDKNIVKLEDKKFDILKIDGSNNQKLKESAKYLHDIKEPKIVFCNYQFGLERKKDKENDSPFMSVTYVTKYDLTPLLKIEEGLTYGYKGHGPNSLKTFLKHMASHEISDDDLSFIFNNPIDPESTDIIKCLKIYVS